MAQSSGSAAGVARASSDVGAVIRRFMEQTFLIEFGSDVTESSDLFKSGVIDSFGYIRLCRFLEREFEITFTEHEILSSVLVSHAAIVDRVSKKLHERSSA